MVTVRNLYLLVFPLLVVTACRVPDPPAIDGVFVDNFARGTIGSNYYQSGFGYSIKDGKLSAKGAHNHPLWLRKKLPRNVQIDVQALSHSTAGDIKIEVFGDGMSFDKDGGRYKATGYVLVFGGWKNTTSLIARRDEHGKDMTKRNRPRVEPGQWYSYRIVRQGKLLQWYIDDFTTPFLQYEDPNPLTGDSQAYLGFNNWESDTRFDNLRITPLPNSAVPSNTD